LAGPREFVPPESIPGVVRERVVLRAATFLIDRPGDMEELMDLPSVRSAFIADEYLPYWADVWPAARMLARAVLEARWAPGQTALELGCGLGIAGLAALARGLHVVFSDYDLTAVAFAERNARINGFTNFRGRPFDWREPPADLSATVVLGADLVYEERSIEPLTRVLEAVLRPGGVALFSDPDRPLMPRFVAGLEARGWPVTRRPMRAGSPGQRRVRGTLYRFTRPGPVTGP
jgi:predicted nicotinamide N-methyase